MESKLTRMKVASFSKRSSQEEILGPPDAPSLVEWIPLASAMSHDLEESQ